MIFISYAREDIGIALFIKQYLLNNHYRNEDIFLDVHHVGASKKFSDVIKEKIKSCLDFIVLLSPDSTQSDYVELEVDLAKEKKKPIYPIVVRPIEEIPFDLRKTQGILTVDEYFFNRLETHLLPYLTTPKFPPVHSQTSLAKHLLDFCQTRKRIKKPVSALEIITQLGFSDDGLSSDEVFNLMQVVSNNTR